jgi:hypothetical protein
MSKRKRTSVIQYNTKPIPEPPEKNLGTGLVFLVASFFKNTQSLDIEHVDRNSAFAIRYRGYNYRPHKRRNRK